VRKVALILGKVGKWLHFFGNCAKSSFIFRKSGGNSFIFLAIVRKVALILGKVGEIASVCSKCAKNSLIFFRNVRKIASFFSNCGKIA